MQLEPSAEHVQEGLNNYGRCENQGVNIKIRNDSAKTYRNLINYMQAKHKPAW